MNLLSKLWFLIQYKCKCTLCPGRPRANLHKFQTFVCAFACVCACVFLTTSTGCMVIPQYQGFWLLPSQCSAHSALHEAGSAVMDEDWPKEHKQSLWTQSSLQRVVCVENTPGVPWWEVIGRRKLEGDWLETGILYDWFAGIYDFLWLVLSWKQRHKKIGNLASLIESWPLWDRHCRDCGSEFCCHIWSCCWLFSYLRASGSLGRTSLFHLRL